MRPEKFSDFGRHWRGEYTSSICCRRSGASIIVTESLVASKRPHSLHRNMTLYQGHGVAALLYRSPTNNRRLIYSCE